MDKWYDYENKQWENAKTKDGSMWGWIPKYEYKIESYKLIKVNFLELSQPVTSGYTMHPAFETNLEDRG